MTEAANPKPPLVGSRLWKIAAIVSAGPFLAQLDTTVVNIALPTLSADLHAPLSMIQWVVTGYLLALALMIPLNGWLVNRIGARRVYLVCFGLFALASVCCGLAVTAQQLIGFRILQGLAGGLLAPMAQMMVARHAQNRMAQMMVLVSLPVLLAPIFGPFVAGTILHSLSWHWLFFLNLPIAVSAIVAAYVVLPPDDELQPRKLDIFGLMLISPGLVLLLDGLKELATNGAHAVIRWGEVVVATVMIVWFVVRGWRLGGSSLIDMRLFNIRTFSASASTQFLSEGTAHGGQMLIPLYLLFTIGMTPAAAGLLLAAMGVGMLSSRIFIERAIRSFGPQRVSVAGAAVALAATLVFAWPGGMPVAAVAVALFVRGFGMGFVNMPSFVSAYLAVPRPSLTDAATSLNIVQRLGGPAATMAVALVLQHGANAASGATTGIEAAVAGYIPPSAFPAAFGLLCAINLFCLIAATRLPRQSEDVRPAGSSR